MGVEDDDILVWSLICENYSLVPGVKFEILDRIEDELWA